MDEITKGRINRVLRVMYPTIIIKWVGDKIYHNLRFDHGKNGYIPATKQIRLSDPYDLLYVVTIGLPQPFRQTLLLYKEQEQHSAAVVYLSKLLKVY